ncbi:MAG: hypothetical protein F6J93_27410 [Oscillatoria sp. SIO1A7]|nr:hypothetical protein [Oscillatoria sp. SIO1A7]
MPQRAGFANANVPESPPTNKVFLRFGEGIVEKPGFLASPNKHTLERLETRFFEKTGFLACSSNR